MGESRLRIVGGADRGRLLAGPAGLAIRPSSDRLREALFNILASRGLPDGAVVLDVFAGTGALGLEALSRGAAQVTFIEVDRAARRLIESNLAAVKRQASATVLGRDATTPGAPCGVPATLVFLDAPYGRGLNEAALAVLDRAGWLAPEALVLVEHEAKESPAWPPGFAVADRRRYGKAGVTILTAPAPGLRPAAP